MAKGPGQQNELARKSKEMTYPNIYKKHKYGATDYAQYDYKSVKKAKTQKVVVRSTGTGKIYGARAVAQRSVENKMEPKVTSKLLQGALEILTDNVILPPKIKVTRLAETTLEKPKTINSLGLEILQLNTVFNDAKKYRDWETAKAVRHEITRLTAERNRMQAGTEENEDPTMVNDPNVSGNNTDADVWADTEPPSITSPMPSTAVKELQRALRILKSVKRTMSNLRRKAAQENDEVLVLSCEHEVDMLDAAIEAITNAKHEMGDQTAEPTTDTDRTAPTLDASNIPHVAGYTPEGKPIIEYSLNILQWQQKKRLRSLRQQLEAGKTVNVNDATYKRSSKVHDEFNWGELEVLGFAERVDVRGPRGSYDEAWKYTGPEGSSINVITQGSVGQPPETKILRPGETTDSVRVDYSEPESSQGI